MNLLSQAVGLLSGTLLRRLLLRLARVLRGSLPRHGGEGLGKASEPPDGVRRRRPSLVLSVLDEAIKIDPVNEDL